MGQHPENLAHLGNSIAKLEKLEDLIISLSHNNLG